MRKISVLVVLLFIAILTPVAPASASTPKAGGVCAKLGASKVIAGKRFTCVRTGKKFVWYKGVSVKSKPIPAVSPVSTPEIFSAKIPIALPVVQNGDITFANAASQYASIGKVAWQRVQDVITANSAVDIPTTISIGPNTGTTKEQITRLLQREYRLFAGFSQPSTYLALVYNGKDEPWAETEFTKIVAARNYQIRATDFTERVMRGACDLSNPADPVCASGNALIFGNSTDGATFHGVQEPYWTVSGENAGPMSQVDHEYTHNVQFAQWIGSPPQGGVSNRAQLAHRVIPCWFQEGQANAIGITVWASDLRTYLDARRGNIARAINPNEPKPSLADFSAASFTKFLGEQDPLQCYQPGTNGDYQLGYSVGYAAVEVLVAIGGPQATMALLSLTASGDTWENAFRTVYGISWQEGAGALGQALAAEYEVMPLGSNG